MEIKQLKQMIRPGLLLAVIGLLTACATAPAGNGNGVTPDPLETPNRVSYDFNETLDRHLIRPVAETYVDVTPEPVRKGVTNFFNNITYLNVILNTLLQGKFDQAIAGSLRFLYNSTFGLGGLYDISTEWGVPAGNEDFGQTLAVWGFDQGAYLYIPLLGPNTVRNTPDYATSILLNPLTYVTGAVLFPLTAANIINTRANLLDETRIRDEAAVDPYTFTREAYLQQRNYHIHDGNPPVEGYDSIFEGNFSAEDDDGVLVIE